MLPTTGLQNSEHRFISPPISPISPAEAPTLPEKPVMSGVTSMDDDIKQKLAAKMSMTLREYFNIALLLFLYFHAIL